MDFSPWSLSRRSSLAVLLLFIFGAAASACFADTAATNAARDLARKISAQLDSSRTLHADFRDLTNTLGAAELNEAQRTFEAELIARGFHFSLASSAQLSLSITLSRDLDSRMWVAEFLQDSHPALTIVSFALPLANSGAPQGAILIQRQLVLSQSEPILDFAFAGSPSDPNTPLLVLSPASISVLRFRDKSWQLRADKFAPIHRGHSSRPARKNCHHRLQF